MKVQGKAVVVTGGGNGIRELVLNFGRLYTLNTVRANHLPAKTTFSGGTN